MRTKTCWNGAESTGCWISRLRWCQHCVSVVAALASLRSNSNTFFLYTSTVTVQLVVCWDVWCSLFLCIIICLLVYAVIDRRHINPRVTRRAPLFIALLKVSVFEILIIVLSLLNLVHELRISDNSTPSQVMTN